MLPKPRYGKLLGSVDASEALWQAPEWAMGLVVIVLIPIILLSVIIITIMIIIILNTLV